MSTHPQALQHQQLRLVLARAHANNRAVQTPSSPPSRAPGRIFPSLRSFNGKASGLRPLSKRLHQLWAHPSVRRQRSAPAGRVFASSSFEDPAPEFNRVKEIALLQGLREQLNATPALADKVAILDKQERVSHYMQGLRNGPASAQCVWDELDTYSQFLVKGLAAIGQAHVLEVPERATQEEVREGLAGLVKLANHLESFYDVYGGLVGYQLTVLELMEEAIQAAERQEAEKPALTTTYEIPAGLNLGAEPDVARKAAAWGIQELPKMAEMYPVGGAGDRLGLVDEVTGEDLPAAMLPYCGRTMFDGLIRDLQAREYLYYRLYGEQHTTPVAVMTSAAKRNHERLEGLCEDRKWFGRPRESFRLMQQSLVPVVTVAGGRWQRQAPFTLTLKPGGHGVMWKLARDLGVLDWFKAQGRTATLVRQISNPLAGTDSTLLALSGMGQRQRKAMGFASCERKIGAAEGMNVLTEGRNAEGKWEYGVSNVEYTDFAARGLVDAGATPGSKHSKYPANTNILYLGIEALEGALRNNNGRAALPGMLVNLTKKVADGAEQVCRLECSMQNIAESLLDVHEERLSASQWDKLSTFVSYNLRSKVTSSAKKKRAPGSTNIAQTPDGSFLTLQNNAADLLKGCGMKMPREFPAEEYLEKGPSFLVWLHPALGPLWSVTQQKIQGGKLAPRAELGLELAEVALENVNVEGSLLIHAADIMGHMTTEGTEHPILKYSDKCGRCRLVNVTVKNAGCDWAAADNVYWKNSIKRKETVRIVLEGNSEFDAEDVTIKGAQTFAVPDGFRMMVTASETSKTGFATELIPLEDGKPSWRWVYAMDGATGAVNLQMEEAEVEVEAAVAELVPQVVVKEEGGRRWRPVPWGQRQLKRFGWGNGNAQGNGNQQGPHRRLGSRFRRKPNSPGLAT